MILIVSREYFRCTQPEAASSLMSLFATAPPKPLFPPGIIRLSRNFFRMLNSMSSPIACNCGRDKAVMTTTISKPSLTQKADTSTARFLSAVCTAIASLSQMGSWSARNSTNGAGDSSSTPYGPSTFTLEDVLWRRVASVRELTKRADKSPAARVIGNDRCAWMPPRSWNWTKQLRTSAALTPVNTKGTKMCGARSAATAGPRACGMLRVASIITLT
mmetsp:Transcript_16614/g.37320  ORF Transcript_16614/g.37320 Transcript_16614/m.37320 type:complete len:217 (-) Transcript_16614:13-663(-)